MAASENSTNDPGPTKVTSTDFEKAYEDGYLGEKVDPAPNEDYTIAGVLKGAKK